MTLEAKSPALSGQSAIDSGKKGGEFVHDVLHRITDRFIAGPLARKQVISADAEDFRQLQENINGAPALAALDLVHMLMADIQPEKLKRVRFILKDPTRIFINVMDWRQLIKRGFSVSVLKNIRIAAVTVNPFSPGGYSFEHGVLRDTMQEALPDIPVIDVRM